MKEPREFDYFKAWLLFFLVATIGGGLVGLVIGSFLAAFLGAGGMPLPEMTRILQVVGFVIGIPISYITFRAVVGKYLFPKIEEDEPPKVYPIDEANGPIAIQVQHVCHDTLPWLISFSLDR